MRVDSAHVEEKVRQAKEILGACIGSRGIAASPDRYAGQNWTRDFTLAFEPYLLESGDHRTLVKAHLRHLALRQQKNGQIPILFLDKTWPFLTSRVKRSLQKGACPMGQKSVKCRSC